MADQKKDKKEELVTARKSVHVIFLSCPHCGKEKDHIEMCGDCGEAMRVIDVVEKFGEDAERFLKRVEKRKENGKDINVEDEDDYIEIDKEEPNIILMGADDHMDDGGIDPAKDDEDGLDVIFPDDDADAKPLVDVGVDDEMADILDKLDAEDDDSLDDLGFEEGGLPEL